MTGEQTRLIDLIDDMVSGKDVFFKSVHFVEDVMTREVKTLSLDDSIGKCVEFMKKNRVRHVPIIDSPTGEEEPYLIGVVSDRDVIRQISPYLGKIGQTDSDARVARQPLVQVLTREPKFVTPRTPIADAIAVMVNNHINDLPVLSERKLLGIITSTDILKLFIRLDMIRKLCREKQQEKSGRHFVDLLCGDSDGLISEFSSVLRTVEDIMTEEVVSLKGDKSISAAIEVMQEGKFRHLPIVGDQGKLIGVVSDKDVLQYLPSQRGRLGLQEDEFEGKLFNVAPDDPALKQTVRHIMCPDTKYVSPDCDFYEMVRIMYEAKVSCLPVIDKERNLLGIVTVTDVMRSLLAIYKLLEKTAV